MIYPKNNTENEKSKNIERSKSAVLAYIARNYMKGVLSGNRGGLLPGFALRGVAEAEQLSIKHKEDLEIKIKEMPRYFGKSAYLTATYSGFAVNGNEEEAIGAGKAGFLSCAYDVASDWRDKHDPYWRDVFSDIAQDTVPKELQTLGLGMYDRDISGKLEQDGLERGIIAFETVTKCMGTYDHFQKKTDPVNLGLLLQIVDDVLDLEEDEVAGDENCLLSPRRDEYLVKLIEELPQKELERLFQANSILVHTINFAREKAQRLLISN